MASCVVKRIAPHVDQMWHHFVGKGSRKRVTMNEADTFDTAEFKGKLRAECRSVAAGWRLVLTGSRRRAGSGRLLGWCEELGECLGERLGMGQGGGVPGAGDLVHPCVGDVFRDVLGAGGEEGLGVRSLQHQHGR